MDEFFAVGQIPTALIRWQMTGLTDEMETLLDKPSRRCRPLQIEGGSGTGEGGGQLPSPVELAEARTGNGTRDGKSAGA